MKKKLMLVWILSMPVWAFSQISLSGRVVDGDSKEPLPGAHVILEDTYNFAVTSTDGTFKFENLKSSEYALKVSFIGFDDFKKELYLDENLAIEIELKPGAFLEDEVVIRATRASVNSPET
nr:carboxypeptidase-like regulatory domain-containing protein [Bacteroidota bacterium]